MEVAVEVCTQLQRAYRAVRFYPPDHPLAGEALSRLATAFREAMDDRRPLRLAVTESALLFEDEIVYESEDLREGIPFLLFRDGVRTVVFLPGLMKEEILGFVEVLVRAQEVDKSEHDVVTMLWERDFAHLDYVVVDPLLDGEVEGEDEVERLAGAVRKKVRAAGSADLSRVVRPEALTDPGEDDSTPQTLPDGRLVEEGELQAIESSLETEPDVLEEFGIVLLEVLANAKEEDEIRQAADALRDLMESYLEWGEFRQLTRLLAHVRTLQPDLGTRKDLLTPIIESVSAVEPLRKAVFALDRPDGAKREGTEEFLLATREWTYPVLVDLLVEAGGKQSRKVLLNVLMEGEGVPLRLVLPRLRDPRWYVVRNMVYLLGRLRDPAALVHLEPIMNHPDDRVRKEAIRAIALLGDPRGETIIASALEDPSPSVRIVAARQLGASRARSAVGRLVKIVGMKDFPNRSEGEVDAFLDTLGRIGDDSAVPALHELWAGRSLFRSKPQHVRLLALRALGAVGTPAAREELARASRDGNEAIRQQAKRSMWDAERAVSSA